MQVQKYSENFERLFNYTRSFCKIIGLDVIKKDFKFSWRTICVFLVVNSGIGVTFYTAFLEIIVGSDYNNLFKTGSVLGTALQGYSKAITLLKEKDNFRFLYTEIKDMYETYEKESLSYKKVLKYNISLVKSLLATIFTIVTVTSLAMIVVPVFSIVVLETRLEILPYKIPGLDYQSEFGFYVTSVTHIVCVILAGYGNFVCDSWLFIYVGHIPLMKNILKCKFEELNAIVETNPKDIEKSFALLMDIFKWHQKYNVYCSTIKDSFFWVIFIQIVTEFFGIACTVVCMFLDIWPPAPVFAFYLFAMIYSYCALGNLVEISNDDIIGMIYDCCWHNLTTVEQKLIVIMLRKSQVASGIPIGGVAPLSLNTALQLTKTIYTFSMMLMETFN